MFGKTITYGYLQHRFEQGAVIKAVKLTNEFPYEAFRRYYTRSAVPLFLVEESGKLTILTAENSVRPRAGQTLIALVDPAIDSTPTRTPDRASMDEKAADADEDRRAALTVLQRFQDRALIDSTGAHTIRRSSSPGSPVRRHGRAALRTHAFTAWPRFDRSLGAATMTGRPP